MSEPCKVCEKPGNGIHYGVWTCESCKCFFRRFGEKGIEHFVCNRGWKCNYSNIALRINCKYCRLQKCVETGMAKNKSRRNRLVGQAQRAITPNDMVSGLPSPSPILQTSELMGIDDDPQTELLDQSKLGKLQEINKIVDSYKKGCCFTLDKIDSFELKNFEIVNTGNLELDHIKAWTDYSKEYDADIRALIPFLASLQDSFSSEDKVTLLKRSAFQLYILRRFRVLNHIGLVLSDGGVIKKSDLQFLYGFPLVDEMLKIVDKIVELGCSDEDVAMLTTLVYYKPGKLEDIPHLNLQSPEKLSSVQQKFKKLFVTHAENRGVDQTVFMELIKLLPELERLQVIHQENIQFLKQYRSAFPQDSFFVSMYDLEPMINTGNLELDHIKAWTNYAKEYDADIRALILFLASLQDTFSFEDKITLLKRSAFQPYILQRFRVLNHIVLVLSDSRVMKKSDLQFLYGFPLVTEMLKIVDKIVELGCSDEDVAMLTTLVYYKPGKLEGIANLNLQNPENLSPVQRKFKKLFVTHAENRDVDQTVFMELIKLLPELEKLQVMHQEKIQFLKQYRSAFPQDSFFVNIYDLEPKIDAFQSGSNLPSSLSATN